MKLYEQYPGLLYSRGKLRDSHLQEIIDGGYVVIQLAPPKQNDALAAALPCYHHFPVPDGKLTLGAKLKFLQAAGTALYYIEQGKPVIVHCNAGRNRAGLLSALVLRELLGLTGSEAMERVRAVRPRAIANPEFEAWLVSLDKPEDYLPTSQRTEA